MIEILCLSEILYMLPEDKGLEQPYGALTGDIEGYVIASECRTFYMKNPGDFPWQVPICITDVAQIVYSRADIIKQADDLLHYLRRSRSNDQKQGFNPAEHTWQIVAVHCSTLAEPAWRVNKYFSPITFYMPAVAD